MKRIIAVLLVAVLSTDCSRKSETNELQPAPHNAGPVTAPKPRPTIDPKSSKAAEELVRGFASLLNQGRLGDAYMLLGPNAPPRSEFTGQWRSYSDLEVTEGAAGAQEGAAGSIYVSVPLTISGKVHGQEARRGATVVLRRVNDVPGSTEAQRHWHIERIEWENS
jgi:hypothetical protein